MEVHVHDPVPDPKEAVHEYGIELAPWDALPRADALVAAVAHKQFLALSPAQLAEKVAANGCVMDVKARLDASALRAAGLSVWRL
jgi:UDP-N-acetyl-D-galactosamine dehydrogenase